MADTFEDACMWYCDGFKDSTDTLNHLELFVAKYFWDSAVHALEHKLDMVIDEVKGMKMN